MALQALNNPAFREQFTHSTLDLLLSLYTNPDEQKEKLFLAKAKAIGRYSPEALDALMRSHRVWREYHTVACWISLNVQKNIKAIENAADTHLESNLAKDTARLHLYFREHPHAIEAINAYSLWRENHNALLHRSERQHAYKTRLRPMPVVNLPSDGGQGLNL